MTDIVPFDFNDQPIRVVMIDGEPWWVASDVCKALGITNVGNALDRLPNNCIRSTDVIPRSGAGNPNTRVINEAGLYRLVLRSAKPEAEPFITWITEDVLPQIRKTGQYRNAELTAVERAEQNVELAIRNLALEKQKLIDGPKADRYDLLEKVDGGYSINSVGRMFGWQGAINDWRDELVEIGALVHTYRSRAASAEWLELGYMVPRGRFTPVITESGLKHLESFLVDEG